MNEPRTPKLFVLDTNVILHDSSCITHFEEHDIALPITVLEELDKFKKGNEAINFHAREFVRTLDDLSGDELFEEGVRIGPGHGRFMIKLDCDMHPDLKMNFSDPKPDNRILNIAYHLAKEQNRPVILVSKDVNLRMKAKSIAVPAQDYTTDHVKNVTDLYAGRRIQENVPAELTQQMYMEPFEVDPEALRPDPPLMPNEYMILRNHRKSALGCYNPLTRMIRRVDKRSAYGIVPRNAEQTFALDALLNPDVSLVTIVGKAGTGKTLLALSASLQLSRQYRHICIARPIVPLSNKDTGYLPGDIHSKLSPYLQPLYDNLGVIRDQFPENDKQYKKISESLENGRLNITALSYIRGRSLMNTFFIIDEAQNLTPHEVKTIITRAGEGTKVVFTGDIFQIDHPYLDSHSNGLSFLIAKMQGQNLYAHVTLEKGERSQLAELASNLL